MSKQFCRKDSPIHGVGRLAAGSFLWPYTSDRRLSRRQWFGQEPRYVGGDDAREGPAALAAIHWAVVVEQ